MVIDIASFSWQSLSIYFSSLLFMLVTWNNLRLGSLLVVGLLPLYTLRLRLGPLPLTMLEVLIIICLCIWLVKDHRLLRLNLTFLTNQDNPIPSSFRSPIAVILLSSLLAVLVAGLTTAAWGLWKAYFFESIAFFLLLAHTLRQPQDRKALIMTLGLMVVCLWPLALWQWQSGWAIPESWQAADHRRITSVFGYPNALSLLVAPIVALYLGRLHTKLGRGWYVWSWIVIVSGISMIIWARTTGALIALAIAALYLLWRYRNLRPALIMSVVAVMMSVLFVPDIKQTWQSSLQRIQEQTLTLESTSLEIRLNQWQETLRLLADRPLWGSGLGGYQTALTPYHQNDWLEIFLYPHNLFLNFWTELGLAGLVGFIWLMVLIARRLWGKKNQPDDLRLTWGLRAAWVTWFVHGLVDVPYFKNDLAILFWILVLLTVSHSPNVKTQPQGTSR